MTLAELISNAECYKRGEFPFSAFQSDRERYVFDNIEVKHLGWFVKGAIADYFEQTGMHTERLNSEQFRSYYFTTLDRAYSYLKYGRTDGSWSDLQCSVALEAMKMFLPGLYV